MEDINQSGSLAENGPSLHDSQPLLALAPRGSRYSQAPALPRATRHPPRGRRPGVSDLNQGITGFGRGIPPVDSLTALPPTSSLACNTQYD
jgi:hypothetical protein